MHALDASRVDLNLLPVLDALLAERSVTKAAARLGLTQPTLSHALARLRELAGDALLVRVGREMVPTPRAEALAPALRRTLADVTRLLAHEGPFEPARSSRAFTILCPDLLAAFVPDLLGRAAREAPGVRIEARLSLGVDESSALALGSADVALGPVGAPDRRRAAADAESGLRTRSLGTVRWCVLARRGHPAVRRGRIDRASWLQWPHIVVATSAAGDGAAGAARSGFVGEAIGAARLERRVGFVAPSALAALFAVGATDLFHAAPRELVADIARRLDLLVIEPPIALPTVRVALTWHERMHDDPGHAWLRGLLVDVATRVLSQKTRRSRG